MSKKVRFTRAISFLDFSYSIGEEVDKDDIPESVIDRLLTSGSVVEIATARKTIPSWPLVSITPEKYLEDKPDGPRSELARRILELS